MQINKHVKHSYFIVKVHKVTILLLLYCLHWLFDKNVARLKVYTLKSTYNYKKNEAGVKGDKAYLTLNTIVATNGSSQRGNEAFMAKM